MIRRTGIKKSLSSLKRGSIKRVGARTKQWSALRSKKVETDVNEEGLIRCQDHLLGLPRCGVSREPAEMDLHHSKGRDGKLLTDERYLVWLTRECHRKVHEQSDETDN